MAAKSTKVRLMRFNGSGNVRSDGRSGWQLTCSRCTGASKIFRIGMSPNALVRKFTQLGWEVGASKDVCPDCQGKTIASHAPLAVRALHDMSAPMVKDEHGKSVHFNNLKARVANLGPDEAKQLIEIARGRIPPKPKREKKQPKPAAPDDPDYEEWLKS